MQQLAFILSPSALRPGFLPARRDPVHDAGRGAEVLLYRYTGQRDIIRKSDCRKESC